MASSNAQQEPTMEEILASIRRIISEDGEEGAGAPAPEQASQAEEAPVADEETEEPLAPTPEAEAEETLPEAEADVLELTEVVEEKTILEEASDRLVSEQTAAKASQPLSHLSGLLVRNYPGSENTLEGVVREILRPLLKAWLDDNLPEIVEKMVAREIARITGRT
ncbi:MAG: DUF2497 domain-containing protein [Pseudomonadota bacterium]